MIHICFNIQSINVLAAAYSLNSSLFLNIEKNDDYVDNCWQITKDQQKIITI